MSYNKYNLQSLAIFDSQKTIQEKEKESDNKLIKVNVNGHIFTIPKNEYRAMINKLTAIHNSFNS